MAKKLFIKTYGCQMNVYDSEKMFDILAPFGYEPAENHAEADIIILNTCHIREKAAEKTYSELGRIRDTKKRDSIIAVAGCVAQAEGSEIFARAPYVDIVVGPQSYHSLPDLIGKILRKEGKKLIELDFKFEEKFDNLPEEASCESASAFVSVQEGCDKFCSFCVVPYTRGAEFSRPFEQVYREALQKISKGAKEIILLGQNVNAYRGKTPDSVERSLADLIKYLAKIDGLERIRYTTSHPIDMKEDLIELHGSEPKLMPFLHLPVQSGSDKILKAMNRKHDREYYFDIIDKIRKARPDIVLSSDFIVGFPGETDEDFADTLDLVKRVGYGQCYSFKYSPRPGTPGAMREQVPEEIKSQRLAVLQEELRASQYGFNKSCLGKIMPILFDRAGKFDDKIIGKSPYGQSVYLDGNQESLYGKILEVEITEAYQNALRGILFSEKQILKYA